MRKNLRADGIYATILERASCSRILFTRYGICSGLIATREQVVAGEDRYSLEFFRKPPLSIAEPGTVIFSIIARRINFERRNLYSEYTIVNPNYVWPSCESLFRILFYAFSVLGNFERDPEEKKGKTNKKGKLNTRQKIFIAVKKGVFAILIFFRFLCNVILPVFDLSPSVWRYLRR